MLARTLLAIFFAAGLHAQPAAVFSQVDEMLATLTEITGWEVRRAIPREILSREAFTKTVEEGVRQAEKNKDVRAAELTLKMFGLAPWDFNLARETGDLVAEQAAAFYDFDKKRLMLLDSTEEGAGQRIALAHELAHALADQHHSLKKYLDGAKSDDESLARQAAVEGQATWLSWAYLSASRNGRLEVPLALVDQFAAAAGGDGESFPVISRVPFYIRESLVFPYSEGMRFQDALFRQNGKEAFHLVFQHPPRSSQQILHPYGPRADLKPSQPALLKLERVVGRRESRQFRKLIEGDVGEFDYSALLRQYVGEQDGRDAASHWRGGSYALFEHKKRGNPLLMHASEWDSVEAAKAFYNLYLEVLRGKWQKMEIRALSDAEASGAGDTGDFLVRLDGASVHVVEGIHVRD